MRLPNEVAGKIYASLPACSLVKRRIEKQLRKCARLHAGSDAYPGLRQSMRWLQSSFICTGFRLCRRV